MSNAETRHVDKSLNLGLLISDTRVVQSARVVAHTTGWLGPPTPMSDNHWSIYLTTRSDKDSSVRLNMRASYGDLKGILECSSLSYWMPYSAIRFWDYEMHKNITVGHICQLLLHYGRHRYYMSGGGSGCRYWVYVHDIT
jgi:hypothetical protein